MAKSMLDILDDYFYKELKQARTNPKAYEAATDKFEQDHGFDPGLSYRAYRSRKDRKKKSRD